MKVKLSPGSYQTVMYGSGIVIMKLVSLIMIPYVTRFLSPLEFGTLEIVLTFFSLSSIVFGFGLAEAMFRYAGLTTSASEQAKICAATTGLTLLLSLILGAVFFFLAPLFINLLPGNINNFQMNLMIFTIMLDSLIGVQLSWLRLKNQVKTFLWLSCTRALLQALFVVIFLALGYSVTGVIIAGALSTSIIFLIIFVLQIRDTGIEIDLAQYKRILIYGSPLVITGIASFATFGLTQWWLAKYIGVSQMAEYALAMKFAMVTAFVFSPFTLWWQPRRFALLNENEGIAANARIASMGVAISFIAGLAVAIAGDVAIKLLTPEVYHEAGLYLPWLSMMWAIKNVGELLNLGCYTQKTTNKVLFIEYSSAFFAVIGYYFLIPKFGISGAIISMYIAFIVRFLLFFYFSQKVLYLPYPIFKLFIICFLSMVGSYVGSHIGNIVWESLSAIVLVSAISILGMWLGVVPKLKHILRR